ncbi:MAG: DUF3267 domain-containing protein [Eubacteriales bacterium]
MKEQSAKPGDILEYDGVQYKVIENRIKRGTEKRKVIINLNLIALPIMILVFAFLYFLLALLNKGTLLHINLSTGGFIINMLIIFGSFIVFAAIHECAHYLAYKFIGKTKKENLKLGIAPKSGMAYCIALSPNTVSASRWSLMMPIYALIIPLSAIAIILQSTFFIFLVSLFASGSAGDIWYMWTMRKDTKDKYIIEALPASSEYEVGYLVLEKIN